MPPLSVVTDTTGYLPRQLVEGHGITEVSLYVNFGGERSEREADLMKDLPRTYEEIRSANPWPTTSQPSVGDFRAAYEPALAAGNEVISLHISGGISGTVEAARQAADQLREEDLGGERVTVYDSQTAAGGLALLAMTAARAGSAGAGAAEALERVERAREALKIWFQIDSLEYLKRSGRIGAASAWIGSTLKIKPILTLENEITPVERVRTSTRAFERMVDYARQREASGADGWVVQHIQAPDEAAELADRCREIFGSEPIFTSEVGPVLGVHTGPGLLGVGGIPRSLIG